MWTLAFLPFEIDPMMASIVAFIAVFGGAVAAIFMMQDASSKEIEDRLDVLSGKKKAKTKDNQVTREALVKESVQGLAGFSEKIMERFTNIRLLFVQADTAIRPEVFFMIMVLSGAVGTAFAVAMRAALPFYPLVFVICAILPFGWLMFKRSRRFKRFGKQLPDAMELVARALRSGHSLNSALKVVVDELSDPISKEFNIAFEEQNLGIPIEDALKHVYIRVPNMDYKFFAMAVAIQRQSGGDLAEILDKIGRIVRDRFRIMGQVQALTGEGRISGIVLMALPLALFVAVWKLNPEYVMLLFTDELGRKMVAAAVVLQVIGAYTIKKIIAIKV
ncbi:type II secretion system F family protein [Thalassoglobus polymorphus]|uniref:Bacterial type II secretion system protein F domain protein n=1 Tax=Thalassoglobus polymorphus TaxID=2527994 RepID=A0A517QJH6_9PLAN|nr:type II secretion system F family protein [Thalassoglobus polymorphus]QDT31786.1 Bacterial type II secretion system protein F domain protein [Thalassoglobus polymorphus]